MLNIRGGVGTINVNKANAGAAGGDVMTVVDVNFERASWFIFSDE